MVFQDGDPNPHREARQNTVTEFAKPTAGMAFIANFSPISACASDEGRLLTLVNLDGGCVTGG